MKIYKGGYLSLVGCAILQLVFVGISSSQAMPSQCAKFVKSKESISQYSRLLEELFMASSDAALSVISDAKRLEEFAAERVTVASPKERLSDWQIKEFYEKNIKLFSNSKNIKLFSNSELKVSTKTLVNLINNEHSDSDKIFLIYSCIHDHHKHNGSPLYSSALKARLEEAQNAARYIKRSKIVGKF